MIVPEAKKATLWMTWPISAVSGTRKSRCSRPAIQARRSASMSTLIERRRRPIRAIRRG
jgi:hypothetical protein